MLSRRIFHPVNELRMEHGFVALAQFDSQIRNRLDTRLGCPGDSARIQRRRRRS